MHLWTLYFEGPEAQKDCVIVNLDYLSKKFHNKTIISHTAHDYQKEKKT